MTEPVRPKSTRDRILEVTIELLWQYSYGTVSVDNICHVAKIQKGSFYHYFPSKVDVVIEAFEKLWQDNRHIFEQVFSRDLHPLERINQYCEVAYSMQKEMADRYGKVLGCPYMACATELCTQEERIRTKMDEMFNRSAVHLEDLLRDAMALGLCNELEDPQRTSHEMLAYVCGLKYQAKLKNDIEVIGRDLKPGLMRYFKISPEQAYPAASPQVATEMA